MALLALLTPQLARAQAVQAAPATQYQYYSTTGQSLSWLFNPQIEKELEIVPEQKEKLTKIRTEMQGKRRDMYKSFKDVDASERRKKYYEAYQELGKETDKKVREVLLDHQLDRLQQIMLQMKLRGLGYGATRTLAGDELAEVLGITEEQKKELAKMEQEIREEMRQKTQEFYEKLRKKAREKLLRVLSKAQRKKLKEMMGEEFEWQRTPRRGGQGGAASGARGEKKQ